MGSGCVVGERKLFFVGFGYQCSRAWLALALGHGNRLAHVLDKHPPFDEAYRVPQATGDAINRVKSSGKRIIAVGTTVVRTLEHSIMSPMSPDPRLEGQRICYKMAMFPRNSRV